MDLYNIIFTLLIYGGGLICILIFSLYLYAKYFQSRRIYPNLETHISIESPSVLNQIYRSPKPTVKMVNGIDKNDTPIGAEHRYITLEKNIKLKPRYTVLNEQPVYDSFYKKVSNF